MSKNIKVAVRVRPLLPAEIKAGHSSTKLKINKIKNEIGVKTEDNMIRTYHFDNVFDMDSNQDEVFKSLNISTFISKLIEGFHCTIFAYGQTGSGKTYTMEHYEYALTDKSSRPKPIFNNSMDGIVHKGIIELFKQIEEYKAKKDSDFKIFASFLQIYNEKIYDLLNMKNATDITAPLRLRWSKEDQFTVDGLYMGECNNMDNLLMLYNNGIKNRYTATHKMNIASSRSHTIFSIFINNSKKKLTSNGTYSKLQFVDLAGSERSLITDPTNKRFKER